jgi:hypothetical protein
MLEILFSAREWLVQAAHAYQNSKLLRIFLFSLLGYDKISRRKLLLKVLTKE